MNIRFCVLLFSLSVGIVGRADAGYNPVQSQSISAKSEAWTIPAIQIPYCPSCRTFTVNLRVMDNHARTERRLAIPTELTQADSAFVTDANSLVVLGHVNGDLTGVNIIDLRGGKLADAFLGYFPTPSPDLRYLAFVNFATPHGPIGPSSSFVYLIYDFGKTAAQNRLPLKGISGDPAWLAETRVGFPVYPLENGMRKTYESLAATRQDIHLMVAPFGWTQNHVLHFADQVGSAQSSVLVDLTAGIERPLVTVTKLGVAKPTF